MSSWEASYGLQHGELACKLAWDGSLLLLVPHLLNGMVGFSVVLSGPVFLFLVEASPKWEVVTAKSSCIQAVE